MNVQIEESWKTHLQPEFDKDYFRTLTEFVKSEYSQYQIFPPGRLIFNAFNLCPFDKVKVVIIGQDPYHGPGQAHGLCFSVNDGVQFPPSLVNIFKEIKADIGTDAPTTGNLTRWAEQGVLLLNATLTVRAHQAGSHQNRGWETFTDAAIRALAESKEHLVFILWGSYAQKKETRHACNRCQCPGQGYHYRCCHGYRWKIQNRDSARKPDHCFFIYRLSDTGNCL